LVENSFEANVMKDSQKLKRCTHIGTCGLAVLLITASLSAQEAPEEKTADELALELANPTSALGSMTSNIDFRTFQGDMPGAGGQSSVTYLFQPSIPFPQSNGYNLLFRPAIPIMFNQPVFRPTEGPTPVVDQFGHTGQLSGMGDFQGEAGLGESGFDLAYGTTTKSGLLYLGGMAGTLPTSTNEFLGKDQLALGPEFAIGLLKKWGVVGALVAHQWDVAGGAENVETSSTSIQYFYALTQ
jgi:hypothetical protein